MFPVAPGPGKHVRLCQDDHRHTLLSESGDLQLGCLNESDLGISWASSSRSVKVVGVVTFVTSTFQGL